MLICRRLDEDGEPLCAESVRHALRGAHELRARGRRTDADEQPIAHGPALGRCVHAAVDFHLTIHAIGRAKQGELPERDEVPLAEELLDGALGLVRHVHLPLIEPLEQFLGRQVDQLHFVSRLEHRIGERLAHGDAGDARHHVVQALEVLHVERGVDVDAGGEQLFDVLPALGVAGAGHVGVRELVDEQELRPPSERGVEIELAHLDAVVLQAPAGQDLQLLEQNLRLSSLVRLDETNHDVQARPPLFLRGLEHCVRLAHARGGPEEHLHPAACAHGIPILGPDKGEKRVGIRTSALGHEASRR
ncbi:MAG TPA: hypothetical protein VHQ45_06190 [Gemmatimonadaceae bacterium]|nr:hypothetical protein [Gemmatimonadaceae bacterium]